MAIPITEREKLLAEALENIIKTADDLAKALQAPQWTVLGLNRVEAKSYLAISAIARFAIAKANELE